MLECCEVCLKRMAENSAFQEPSISKEDSASFADTESIHTPYFHYIDVGNLNKKRVSLMGYGYISS